MRVPAFSGGGGGLFTLGLDRIHGNYQEHKMLQSAPHHLDSAKHVTVPGKTKSLDDPLAAAGFRAKSAWTRHLADPPGPTTRRKDPRRKRKTPRSYNAGYSMPYRRRYKRRRRPSRRRRRVRRRRASFKGMGIGRPAKFHRMRHRLDCWVYLSAANASGNRPITSPYSILNNEQTFDIKMNCLHDPYFATTVGTANLNDDATQHLPLFYNTMSTLYSKYKVNNVYCEVTFINNRPVSTDSATLITGASTRVNDNQNEIPVLRAAEPVICGVFPVNQSVDTEALSANDDSWAYRPGAKSALVASQHAHTIRAKFNPARILGLANSFSSSDYVATDAASNPTKVSALRCVWVPPIVDGTTGDSDRAVSVFIRTWWDVTWADPKDTGDFIDPADT